jgi:aminoglycoside phosphotransferase (APT) family kinase protein
MGEAKFPPRERVVLGAQGTNMRMMIMRLSRFSEHYREMAGRDVQNAPFYNALASNVNAAIASLENAIKNMEDAGIPIPFGGEKQ